MSSAEHEIRAVTDLSARRTREQAWRQFASARSAEEFCASWLAIQSQQIGAVSDGVVVLQKPGTTVLVPVAFLPDPPTDRARLAGVTERAAKEGRGVLLRRHADPQEAVRARLKLALDFVSALLEHEGLAEGGAGLVTELATRLGCDRASLGVLERGRITIRAVSHSGQFDRRANLLRLAGEAMEEAIDQQAAVAHPPVVEGGALVSRAHELLMREADAGAAATFPLEAGGRTVGALTLERPAGHQFDVPSLELAAAVAALCGPIVALKLDAERGLAAHALKVTGNFWTKLAGPRHAVYKLVAAATLAAALFFAFASGTYRVSADAAVEGEVLRAITAPIQGFVREAPRRAGDPVKAGEVIGRFDDRELRLERVRLTSQQGQHHKQYREAMAKHDRPQAAMALAQLDQVGARIALQVEEHEFGDIAPGQHGSLAVNSIPHERFPFTVTKITAVNSVKDGRNRFRVEARLDAPPGRLRPGMEGVGKIEIDERKLVWIWTHSLVDRIRLWIWAALP